MQVLNTGFQRAAKTCQIGINSGAQLLAFSSWEVKLAGEDLKTTNFDSWDNAVLETFDEGIMGTLSADVSFGGDWDASMNPVDGAAPPGLYPRDDLGNVTFSTSRLDLAITDWSFPYLRLRGATNGGKIGDKVTFDCSGMNQGPFTRPTGSV